MKTEMEQLEMNTKIQKAKEQAEELAQYLVVRNLIIADMNRWHKRATKYELAFFALMVATIIIKMPIVHELAFLGFMLTFLAKNAFIEQIRIRAQGEFDGAWEVLMILGHVDRDDGPGDTVKRKKKVVSPFKRFKEFFERITSKQNKEAYGT